MEIKKFTRKIQQTYAGIKNKSINWKIRLLSVRRKLDNRKTCGKPFSMPAYV